MKRSLKQRLKSAVTNISVDVFGFEKKVQENVQAYLAKEAKLLELSPLQMIARFVIRKEKPRVYLHGGGKAIKEVKPEDVVHFFMGASRVPGIHQKIESGITNFLTDYGMKHEIEVKELTLLLTQKSKSIEFVPFNGTQRMKIIPVKEVIKYFTQ